MIKIIDKVSWQIEGNNPIGKENVIAHFKFIFEWLNEKKLLTKEGKEILDMGIDSSASLNEKMLISFGLKFLELYYDTYIFNIEYGKNENTELLNKLYQEFSMTNQKNEN